MALPAALTNATVANGSLDFEALLSRDYQPTSVAQIRVKPLPFHHHRHHHHHHHHHLHHHHHNHHDKEKKLLALKKNRRAVEDGTDELLLLFQTTEEQQQHLQRMETYGGGMTAEERALVLKLVTQTPAYLKHLPPNEREQVLQQKHELLTHHQEANASTTALQYDTVPPKFSPLELMDWESQIDWGDGSKPAAKRSIATSVLDKEPHSALVTSSRNPSSESTRKFLQKLSPLARQLLEKKRNPYLDNLDFQDSIIIGYGDPEELALKAAQAPLILELGVAGQSVAHKMYQSTVVQAQHPTPAILQYAYQARVDREWAGAEGKSGGGGGLSGLDSEIAKNVDARKLTKQQLNALIEQRSKKREQMAKDKTNRVTAALGTLALGGGKGRAITSSLMGPGGTERTGRPTRMNAAGVLETEYIEQIDIVTSHSLVRDLSKVLLREYHRPKVPLSVVQPDLMWQFQLRYSQRNRDLQPAGGGGPGGPHHHQGGAGVATSPFHARSSNSLMLNGGGPSLRTETDLSPSDGKLIVVEYSEERPPIQLNKGMCAKIINYYRGDKTHCPVSAGGGDRPSRRKRNDEADGAQTGSGGKKGSNSKQQHDSLPRLTNKAGSDNILDWIGPLPKKPKDSAKGSTSASAEAIDVLPEGVTEILHSSVHGPFLGEIPEGSTLSGFITNLFVAPMFRHEPECTDFLLILTPPSGATRAGQRESMGVILRDFPKSVFCVGQTEPRTRVYPPASSGEKMFTAPYISYQIARAITRSQSREGHGLRLDELQARVLPNLELPGNAFRQRLKQVAIYDKNTQIWTTKQLGFEGYQGVESLGKSIPPEGVAAFETACAASRRLSDLGIHQLFAGNNAAVSVGVCMVYLAGQLNANRELSKRMKKLLDAAKGARSHSPSSLQVLFYEKAAAEIEITYKILRHKHEVAQFINEELQLAPWHLTGEFIDVHKKAEGTGMMKLTGLGDPSGTGEGFSFIREADTKPAKAVGNSAVNAQIKKITGTEDDLRKLTMQQMAALLRSYGMAQKQIDTLKRWDRVHCIRDLSTKAASDGIGDGLERFARGEKLKLSEQKEMYRERIQEIWRRQIVALSGEKAGGGEVVDNAAAEAAALKAAKKAEESDSESDSDDDELADFLEDELMDQTNANKLVAAHAHGGKEDETELGQLRAAAQDNEMSKDARDLFALRRQRDEEKAAQEGLQARNVTDMQRHASLMANRKVIRKRITQTHPDGRQTTTFKFVLHPAEVGKIEARLGSKREDEQPRGPREWNYTYGDDEKPPGHAMFEDEDNFDYSSRGRHHSGKRRGVTGRGKRDGRTTPRGAKIGLQIGKLKTKVSKEDRMRKRQREEEELEVYQSHAMRKSTNNRKERGSIRDRRPHVMFASKLEQIRSAVESRPHAGHFAKPVNRKVVPRYYEVISNPIDLQTIRNKIGQYEYRRAESLLKDFELMKNNAVKFNGETNHIAVEAIAIYDFVRDQIQAGLSELTKLEEAVAAQMDPKKGAKKRKGSVGSKKSSSNASLDAMVNLGDVGQFEIDDSDSGEDDENFLGV